jgi:hypothetical protein
MSIKKFLVVFLCVSLFLIGCTMVHIESDPSGATVLYSSTGMEPWESLGDKENPLRTPALFYRFKRGFYFYKVEKPGYSAPRPRMVETYPFHKENVQFTLSKTQAMIEQEYKDRGFIRLGDKWVDPVKEGLVPYKDKWMPPDEAFAAEQKDKGLVLYQGQWIKAEEKDRLIAVEQAAKGLVQYKGEWLLPEEKEREEKADNLVEEIFQKPYRDLIPPNIIGSIPQDLIRIRVLNGTGDKVIYYFSGKKSRGIPLDPYESQIVDFPPGTYRVAVMGFTPGDPPACLTFDFKSGIRYSLIEEGMPLASKVKTEKALSQQEIRIKYEIPELEIPDQSTTKTEERKGPDDRPRDGRQPRAPREGRGNRGGRRD